MGITSGGRISKDCLSVNTQNTQNIQNEDEIQKYENLNKVSLKVERTSWGGISKVWLRMSIFS